jgi:hypothetical protein
MALLAGRCRLWDLRHVMGEEVPLQLLVTILVVRLLPIALTDVFESESIIFFNRQQDHMRHLSTIE